MDQGTGKTDERRDGERPAATRAAESRPRLDPATPEVAGHDAGPAATPTEVDETEASDGGPEAAGHLFTNPYLLEKATQGLSLIHI